MNLIEQINNDFKEAMKAKDEIKVSTLRLLRAGLENERIALKNKELDDGKAVGVVTREAKKRKESIEAYKKGGRDELKQKEEAELKVLEKYLPEQLSRDKIKEIVGEVIKETGANDFGKVMGAVMGKVKGQADGAEVREVVREMLKETEK